jgi:hypothetical protein
MYRPPLNIIDVLSGLDEHVAAELITLLQALSTALEQHYAEAFAHQQQRDFESRQPSLWPDDDPPF